MPIPQLSRSNRSRRGWSKKRKKYYVSGGRSDWRKRGRSRGWLAETLSNRQLLKLAAYAFVFLFFASSVFVFWLSRGLPDPNRLIERQVAQSTKIYDRTGENILYEIHGEEKRTLINLSDLPEYLKNATIDIEDKDFYRHGGFSFWAIFRTALTNLWRGQRAGGSTLTQQFIKNAVLTSEKTYTRKIKELILAYRVEKKFSKDEILQMYLNEIPYGSTAYGVEAASQRYFGKSAREVNLAEAAVLAALPQAPSRYSPYGSNKDLLIARQHYILDLMVRQEHITEEAAAAAKKTELSFKKPTDNIVAPHFIMYVKEILSDRYGEKAIEQGGYKIYTTLDLYKQKIAEEVVAEKTPGNLEKYRAGNAALVSLDPKTGQILAMVGSRDYFDEKIDGQVNVTTSARQPGSSFKPIVYAASFIKGYTPDTVLYDVVTNFSTDPNKPYEPHNYDSQERGPVTIKKALAGSLNVPAVKTIYLTGINNVLDLADALGYSTLKERSRFGLSLVLGGGEIKLLEHANAFSAFAREGELSPPSAILKIEDKNGKIIEEYKEEKTKIFDAQIARLINNVLADNSARTYVFGANNFLNLGDRPIAAKTGTTNDYKDAWTIGYTPSLVAGVWVGNSDNKEMKRGADGSVVAAPIWHEFMKRVLGDTPIEYFKEPEPIKTGKPALDGNDSGEIIVKIDRASGLLATESTPASFIEDKIFKQPHNILYYVDKDDPRGPAPENPADDPQYNLWEERVRAWTEEQGFTASAPPTEYDNLHKTESQPTFTIESPANNQTITDPLLTATVSASAPRGVSRAEYYINGNLLATSLSYPFSLNKEVFFLNNGFHKLTVRICDDIDNCSSKSREFNLLLADNNRQKKEISISFVEPSNGLAATSNDFPLNIKMAVADPTYTAKIELFYSGQDSPSPQLIASLPATEAIVNAAWTKAPPSGTYKIFAEAYGWDGQFKKSQELTVTVNNLTEN